MLREASSGASWTAGAMRSSTVMCGLPPVVRLMTTSEPALTIASTSLNSPGSCTGWPSWGSRTCRCTIAAPAAAAPRAASAICSGVTGSAGDIVGVWIAPVGAQVMIADLACLAMGPSPYDEALDNRAYRRPPSDGNPGEEADVSAGLDAAAPLVVVAPDKFKGSLTAAGAAAALARGLRRGLPGVRVVEHPIADGGEGTVEMVLRHGFRAVSLEVHGPTGAPVTATYGVRGDTAVVEMAAAAGLDRLPGGAPDDDTARTASTYGV